MNSHHANRTNPGRKLRAAMLCTGVLVLGACSSGEEVTGAGENSSATTVSNDTTTVPATKTIDAETVKDAIRNALEGPVRVTGVDSTGQFVMHVDETGNWWALLPAPPNDDTRSEYRYVNGEWYTLSADHTADEVGSFVWVRSDTSLIGPGVKFTAELLQAGLLLDLVDNSEITAESGPGWLVERDRFLDDADISFDQADGWLLTFVDSGNNTYPIRVVLDDDGRLVSLWNMESSFSLLYDRYTGVTAIEAPATYLEGEAATQTMVSEALARTTRSEAEAMGRNASAIAASTGNDDVLDEHFEAAFDETSCGKDCSFDLATKTFSLTQQDYTCSTTFLIDEYGLVTVTHPVCSKN